jgi:hypothetical protein
MTSRDGMVIGKHASPLLVPTTVPARDEASGVTDACGGGVVAAAGGEAFVVAGAEAPVPPVVSGATALAPAEFEELPELHPLSTAIRQTN